METESLTEWLRNDLLPGVLILLGGVLLATAFVGLGALDLQISDQKNPPGQIVVVPATTTVVTDS